MISTLNNRLSTVATARRMIAIPLLVIALAFATMAALPHGTAYADGGQAIATQQDDDCPFEDSSLNTGQCLLPGIPCT